VVGSVPDEDDGLCCALSFLLSDSSALSFTKLCSGQGISWASLPLSQNSEQKVTCGQRKQHSSHYLVCNGVNWEFWTLLTHSASPWLRTALVLQPRGKVSEVLKRETQCWNSTYSSSEEPLLAFSCQLVSRVTTVSVQAAVGTVCLLGRRHKWQDVAVFTLTLCFVLQKQGNNYRSRRWRMKPLALFFWVVIPCGIEPWTLKIETLCYSETLVPTYESTRCYNPEAHRNTFVTHCAFR
jgi:hypothetical protein